MPCKCLFRMQNLLEFLRKQEARCGAGCPYTYTAWPRVSLLLRSYRASCLMSRPLCKWTQQASTGAAGERLLDLHRSGHQVIPDYWELLPHGCLLVGICMDGMSSHCKPVQRGLSTLPSSRPSLFIQFCSFQVSDQPARSPLPMVHGGVPLWIPPTGRICFHSCLSGPALREAVVKGQSTCGWCGTLCRSSSGPGPCCFTFLLTIIGEAWWVHRCGRFRERQW